MTRRCFGFSLVAAACSPAVGGAVTPTEPAVPDLPPDPDVITPLVLSDAEWKAKLGSQAYDVLRKKGTEYAFTGAYWNNHEKGRYLCAGCGLHLFDSTTKFESGTGWPSFWEPVKKNRVKQNTDGSHGMIRDEVVCARCDGHLGHVFDDGPPPTGLRYCMNSVSLVFRAAG